MFEILEKKILEEKTDDGDVTFFECKVKFLNHINGEIEIGTFPIPENAIDDEFEDLVINSLIESRIEGRLKGRFREKRKLMKVLSELNDLEFYEVIQIKELMNKEDTNVHLGKIANELTRMNDINAPPENLDVEGESLSKLSTAFNKMSLAVTGDDFIGRDIIHPDELMAKTGVSSNKINHHALNMLADFGLIRKVILDNKDMVEINVPGHRLKKKCDST